MKKIFNILLALIIISQCMFTSCTDILDTAPNNKPASSTMWTTANLTEMVWQVFMPIYAIYV